MIVVVPCGAKKVGHRAPAGKLYTGPYFKACLKYALSLVDATRVFILSAKYGLLALSDVVEPYELTLGQPGAVRMQTVKAQAHQRGLLDEQEVVALGGKRYAGLCTRVWPRCQRPLEGVGGMGMQMGWMRRNSGRLKNDA